MSDYNKSFLPNNRKGENSYQYDRHLERSLDQVRTKKNNLGPNPGDKFMLEREEIFGMNTRGDTDEKRYMKKKINNSRTGEITGEMFQVSELEQGMPLRGSAINNKRTDSHFVNKYLDFNIFDKTENDFEIEYNDPMKGSISQYSDIGHTTKLLPFNHESSPIVICSHGINNFSWMLFTMMKNHFGTGFCISPFCLYTLLSSLYICSKNRTEDELRSCCSFPDKNIVFDGLFKIYARTNNINNKLNNILLLNPKIKINPVYLKYISNVVTIDKIDDIRHKCNSINNWVNKITDNNTQHLLTEDVLANVQGLAINVSYFKPELKCNFEKKNTGYRQFKSIKPRNVPMMISYDNVVKYYEDDVNQVIEIDSKGNCRLGIVLPKEIAMPSINYKYFDSFSDSFHEATMDIIGLPKFKQQNKLKLKSLLAQAGLEDIFRQMDLKELLDKQFKLDNIIHSATFILSEGSENNKRKQEGHRGTSAREFIADHPFIYYLRNKETETIFLTGIFI